MSRPLVSVIIPAYNAAKFVAEAIESALAQTYRPFEVIVVNDGSTDDTAQVLAKYTFPVRCVHQPNRGLSIARNRGIAESTGELIAFLDADDKWVAEKLERQVARFHGRPQIGLVHTEISKWDGKAESVRQRVGRERYVGNCLGELFYGNVICVSSVVVRRECVDGTKWFDEAIVRPTTQDFDLWVRIALGWEFDYVPETLVIYRVHDKNASSNSLIMAEDTLYVLEKMTCLKQLRNCVSDRQYVRRRMADAAFYAGYKNWEAGDLLRANRFFRKAISWRPFYLSYAWFFFFASLLPQFLVKWLRRSKRHLLAQSSNPRR